jgi:hypothetical protein
MNPRKSAVSISGIDDEAGNLVNVAFPDHASNATKDHISERKR